MKKYLMVGISLLCIAIAGFFTWQHFDKKVTDDKLAYHDPEEGDIFETGVLDGELTNEPLNPDFMEYEGEPGIRRRMAGDGEGNERTLGWIPSPVKPDIHSFSRAKTAAKSTLAKRYDLRDPDNDGSRSDTVVSPVKKQGSCGACWAFAALAVVETGLSEAYGYLNDFSENNLIHSSYYDWGPCEGGNVDMAMGYLSENRGPVVESRDPYKGTGSSYCEDCGPSRYIDSFIKLPVRSMGEDYAYIREAVYKYGALYASMYWSDNNYDFSSRTYYYPGRSTNHAVTIVGWDDSVQVASAPGPGAFIVKNSWGTGWGDSGFFYISYYDGSLGASAIAAMIDRPDPLLKFDRIYSYDPLGRTSSTGYGKKPAWGANIFHAVADGDIVAVGLSTTAAQARYRIYIYDDFNGSGFERILGGPYSGTLEGKGYHTVPLPDSVSIDSGDSFSVVVEFETPGYNWPVPLEKPFSGYSSGATAGPGEGYISSNGRDWVDVTNSYPGASICIKALVRETSCENKGVSIEGPGHASRFLIENGKGAFIKAVTTDECGLPLTDADVVATFTDTSETLTLYDDGEHDDGEAGDGLYAVPLAKSSLSGSGQFVVSVNGVAGGVSDIPAEEDSGGGGGGSGCFVRSLGFF